ncbi:MAG: ABC transporter ATP-binding protein [Ferruginibacter sp.]
MSSIIKADSVSKSFIISHEGKERYTALRDIIAGKAKKIFSFPRSMKPADKSSKEEFWALKDISFEIEKGGRIGIIGRNGAGKSTLLKILSRITEPTSGTIKIKGRVASLLEVGTGFHPELSGRENIFLNGAILGMNRSEIKKKFDEIVAFAEVEKFLDTPVKRYSSGMYVRLAFAVAAHLEPEILVVDEVLAVGDAEFQKKCLGKMEDVSNNDGRTVLFVSHNMGVIQQLCQKTILLKSGNIEGFDTTKNIIDQYISGMQHFEAEYIVSEKTVLTKPNFFTLISLQNKKGEQASEFDFNESMVLYFKFRIKNPTNTLQVGIGLNDKYQSRIFTVVKSIAFFKNNGDEYTGRVTIPASVIAPNNYSFVFALWEKNGAVHDHIENICACRIHDTGTDMALYEGGDNGCLVINPIWNNDI